MYRIQREQRELEQHMYKAKSTQNTIINLALANERKKKLKTKIAITYILV